MRRGAAERPAGAADEEGPGRGKEQDSRRRAASSSSTSRGAGRDAKVCKSCGHEAESTEVVRGGGSCRYYGSSWENGSWPYGPASFDGPNVSYLTVEQALADYADLIRGTKRRRPH